MEHGGSEASVTVGAAWKTSLQSVGQEAFPSEVKLVDSQEHLANNKWTCYERKATVLADFVVVKVLSPLWWCCSTRTCATFDSGAELTVAVQSV